MMQTLDFRSLSSVLRYSIPTPGRRFLRGEMRLDADLAREACEELGGHLGLDADETAWGIRQIALEGMARAVPILMPLVESDFVTEGPSCDRALVIVQDYLAKYPEMLDKDADAVVEKALLATYSRDSER